MLSLCSTIKSVFNNRAMRAVSAVKSQQLDTILCSSGHEFKFANFVHHAAASPGPYLPPLPGHGWPMGRKQIAEVQSMHHFAQEVSHEVSLQGATNLTTF